MRRSLPPRERGSLRRLLHELLQHRQHERGVCGRGLRSRVFGRFWRLRCPSARSQRVTQLNTQANCGRCGRVCEGGACADGLCPSRLVAEGLEASWGYPYRSLFDGRELFFLAGFDIKAVSKTGGTARRVVATSSTPEEIVMLGEYVYWADGRCSIVRARKAGGGVQEGISVTCSDSLKFGEIDGRLYLLLHPRLSHRELSSRGLIGTTRARRP